MIPTVLHTLWPGDDPFRTEFCQWRETWVRHNPDWSLRFWRTEPTGDARVDRIVSSPLYTPVFKSDVLRWAVLLAHGGFYVDADVECLRPWDAVRAAAPTGFLCAREPAWPRRSWETTPAPPELSNAVLGARPHHPFVRHMLEGVIARAERAGVEACNRPGATNAVSGPIALSRAAYGRSDVTVVPTEWFFPEAAPGNEEALGELACGQTPSRIDLGDSFARHHWNAGTRDGHRRMLEASALAGGG
jgi:hypothetical protein